MGIKINLTEMRNPFKWAHWWDGELKNLGAWNYLNRNMPTPPPKKNTEKNNDVKKWKKIFRNNDIIRNSGVYM